MLLGSVNPRLGFFIPISPPPSPPYRKVSGWSVYCAAYDMILMSQICGILCFNEVVTCGLDAAVMFSEVVQIFIYKYYRKWLRCFLNWGICNTINFGDS